MARPKRPIVRRTLEAPPELVEAIKQSAETNTRSVQQEIIHGLRDYLRRKEEAAASAGVAELRAALDAAEERRRQLQEEAEALNRELSDARTLVGKLTAFQAEKGFPPTEKNFEQLPWLREVYEQARRR